MSTTTVRTQPCNGTGPRYTIHVRLLCGELLQLSLPVDSHEPDLRAAIAERTSKFDPHDELRLMHDKYSAIAEGTPLRQLAHGVSGEVIQVSVSTKLERVPVNTGRREVEHQHNAPQQEQQQRATAGVAATPTRPSTSVALDVTKPKSHNVSQEHRSEEHHNSQSSSSSSSVLLTVASVGVAIAVAVALTVVGVPPPLAAGLRFALGLFGFGLLPSTGKRRSHER